MVLPATAANTFHAQPISPPASATSRSTASIMAQRANAHASNAVGNPYVNPNVTGGPHAAQSNAAANANAAEMRSAHVNIGPN